MDVVETFVLDPSRPPPTASDSVLADGEVHMLQRLYNNCEEDIESNLVPIIGQVIFAYGPSISCATLRFSMLAVACQSLYTEYRCRKWQKHLEYYTTTARQALIRKDRSSFGVEDFYTILFLTFSEFHRSWLYLFDFQVSGAERIEVREGLGVQVRGLMAITTHLKSSGLFSPALISGELRAPHFIAYIGSFGNPIDVLEAAVHYRHELLESTNEAGFIKATFSDRGVCLEAFRNIVEGLLRIFLEDLAKDHGSKDIQDAVTSELSRYRHHWDRLSGLHFSSTWHLRTLTYTRLAFLCTDLLSSLNAALPIRGSDSGNFIQAKSLVELAIGLHKDLVRRHFKMPLHEKALCSRIGVAALVPPPLGEVNCIAL